MEARQHSGIPWSGHSSAHRRPGHQYDGHWGIACPWGAGNLRRPASCCSARRFWSTLRLYLILTGLRQWLQMIFKNNSNILGWGTLRMALKYPPNALWKTFGGAGFSTEGLLKGNRSWAPKRWSGETRRLGGFFPDKFILLKVIRSFSQKLGKSLDEFQNLLEQAHFDGFSNVTTPFECHPKENFKSASGV